MTGTETFIHANIFMFIPRSAGTGSYYILSQDDLHIFT